MSVDDSKLGPLREAIRLSVENVRVHRSGPFGAVITRGDEILATGCNRVTSDHDPTAHAEVVAIRAACERLGTHSLAGCTIHASCEPCPMCLAAILWARLDGLVFGATREDAAAAGFDDERFYREIALPSAERDLPSRSALRAEARDAFSAWNALEDKRPY